MAFDFTSPGANATSALFDFLQKRELANRQAMMDDITRQREKRLTKHDDATLARLNEDSEYVRAQRGVQTQAAEQKSVMDLLEQAGAGGAVAPELSTRAKAIGLGGELSETGPMQGPLQEGETRAPGVIAFRGTPKQREEAEKKQSLDAYLANPDVPANIKAFIQAQASSGDSGLPYQLFEGEKTKPIVRVSHDRRGLEIFQAGAWQPVTGEVPKDAQLVIEPAANDGQGGRPYFIPLQTAQGILSFDSRTGTTVGRIGDLKPGETAQKEISNAQTISTVIKQTLDTLDPAKVGPIIGRYKTAEQMLTGGDPAFTAFSAAVSTLQNTVINLRTGAQMSEPEAARILNEIANVNLPPATFIAKSKQAQKYFEEWLKNRAKGAYGRTTTADVDAMVNPAAAPAAGGGAAPAAKPSAADLINKYGGKQ